MKSRYRTKIVTMSQLKRYSRRFVLDRRAYTYPIAVRFVIAGMKIKRDERLHVEIKHWDKYPWFATDEAATFHRVMLSD